MYIRDLALEATQSANEHGLSLAEEQNMTQTQIGLGTNVPPNDLAI